MSTLSAFTQQLLNLATNLSDMYPNDTDLEFTKNSISLFKTTNPRKLQKAFNTYIAIYSGQIIEKDESFFINTDIVNDLNLENKSPNAEFIMITLKKYWEDMDDTSKNNIWKYLQVLLILNNKCT